MNITFFLGNGFDIGLGLETSYKQFYNYYSGKMCDKDDLIYKELKKDKDNDYENWSDLEIALGELLQYVSDSDVEKFIDAKINMDNLLEEYLMGEEDKFAMTDGDNVQFLQKIINDLPNCYSEEDRNIINNILKPNTIRTNIYNVITLNYTNSIDKIFKSCKKNIICTKKIGLNDCVDKTGSVLHLHGELGNQNLLVGVNDETQIIHEKHRNNEEIKLLMIKPYLNERLGLNKVSKAKKIIDSSNVICMYGVSIGQTDKMWWEYIIKWLNKSSQNILIIYNYDKEFKGNHAYKNVIYNAKKREEFLSVVALKEDVIEKLSKQIIIKNNQNICELAK